MKFIICEQLNRSRYVMKLYSKFYDFIIRRWEKYAYKKDELCDT